MNGKFYTMKELPESEQPYEKLEKHGPSALSDAELLAVLIRNGTQNKNSVALASEILTLHPIHKGLMGLHYLSLHELKKLDGIGKVKAAQLLCAAEISNRMAKQRKPSNERFDSPNVVAQFFMEEMRTKETEQTIVVYLDNKCRLLRYEILFMGTVSSSLANPREILKKALQYDATCFILLHNHPSGDPTPSSADIKLSEQIKEAGELIGIHLLDHIILGDCQYVSLRERGHI
jgi:DNA repair protein RadC